MYSANATCLGVRDSLFLRRGLVCGTSTFQHIKTDLPPLHSFKRVITVSQSREEVILVSVVELCVWRGHR